jgi:hypothetical protein
LNVLLPMSDADVEQLAYRAKAQALAQEILKYPQLELPLYHFFQPGIYIRELHLPAGALTVGNIHKLPCRNILTKGERTTWIVDEFVRIRGPHIHWTPPGHQRVSYTHEDSIWVTIHNNPRDERNIAVLEHEFFAKSEEEYLQFCNFLDMEPVQCLPC